jgi:hypothetical protein
MLKPEMTVEAMAGRKSAPDRGMEANLAIHHQVGGNDPWLTPVIAENFRTRS